MSETAQEVEELESKAKQFDELRAAVEPFVKDGETLLTAVARLGAGTPPDERTTLELKLGVKEDLANLRRINPSITLQEAMTALFAQYERDLAELG